MSVPQQKRTLLHETEQPTGMRLRHKPVHLHPALACTSMFCRAVGHAHFFDTTKRASQRLTPNTKRGFSCITDPATLMVWVSSKGDIKGSCLKFFRFASRGINRSKVDPQGSDVLKDLPSWFLVSGFRAVDVCQRP